MQSKSSRIFLLVAVVLGILATVTTFAFLESLTGKDRGPRMKILAAKRDLKANAVLDPDKDLQELEIPADMTDLRRRALVPEHRSAYKGQRVNRRVLAGTPVWLADLAVAAELQLSSAESRAMAIPVKGANALGGLLVPGDYVKLFVTRPVMRTRTATVGTPGSEGDPPVNVPVPVVESSGRFETTMILPQAVKVLGINQRLMRSRQQVTAAELYESANENEQQQQAVTLEVTEAQAKTILELTGAGQLPVTLVLCPAPTTAPSRY